MEYNNSVWEHYRKGWVDPMYVPYLRKPEGNHSVYVYPPKNDCVGPDLIRNGKGWKFQTQFSSYGCPDRWTEKDGFCVQTSSNPTSLYLAKHPDYEARKLYSKPSGSLRNISFDPETGKRVEYIKGKRLPNNKVGMALDY